MAPNGLVIEDIVRAGYERTRSFSGSLVFRSLVRGLLPRKTYRAKRNPRHSRRKRKLAA
jgi:hypothetical protein